jgi:hypothetical protein
MALSGLFLYKLRLYWRHVRITVQDPGEDMGHGWIHQVECKRDAVETVPQFAL